MSGVRGSRDPQASRLDIAGILALSVAVLSLTVFITEAPRLDLASPPALAILFVSVASFTAFAIVERRVSHPMFDFRVFSIPTFSGALVGAAGMNLSFWPLIIYLPIWFHAGLGLSSFSVGMALLAYTLPTLVVPPMAERLSLRFGAGLVIPAGLFVIGAGLLMIRLSLELAGAGWPLLAPGLVLAGVGLGLTNTPVSNTASGAVSSDRAGMASGLDMSARMITLAINIAVMGAILFNGVLAHLKATPDMGPVLHQVAERVAAGSLETGLPVGLAQQALGAGFGWVTLYGGVASLLLALGSWVLFRAGASITPAANQPSTPQS
mgnify:FL=1